MSALQLSQSDRQFRSSLTTGAQVMYDWALWQKAKGTSVATRIADFRKGDFVLVVMEYGRAFCGVLKKENKVGTYATKFLSFREWSQPFSIVTAKLVLAEWKMESLSVREVNHAH